MQISADFAQQTLTGKIKQSGKTKSKTLQQRQDLIIINTSMLDQHW